MPTSHITQSGTNAIVRASHALSFPPPSPSATPGGYGSSGLNGQQYFHQRRSSRDIATTLYPRSMAAKRSSLIASQDGNGLPRHTRPLRSQYPVNSSQTHVEFILVASFHISTGSVMEHQYPGLITGDEHMLADLMLPDQMHNRSQDWTVFFLHKDSATEDGTDSQSSSRHGRRRRRRSLDQRHDQGAQHEGQYGFSNGEDEISSMSSDEADAEELEGPALIYVLNLVNTKVDHSAERGAIVKAMAICTRHPFLHIYKPVLLLALDEYFKSPRIETLTSLYDAVNSMDLSMMPRFSYLERSLLQASNAKDLFLDRFQRMLDQRRKENARSSASSVHKSPSDVYHTPSSRLLPRDTHEFESRIAYNGISVPVKVPTAGWMETVGEFSIIKLIQTFSQPHLASPQPFALHPHLTTSGALTHPIMVLVNALLTQKRIIFVGHNKPSGEVAEAVLAACSIASGGVLRGFTRHAFPYTDLTKIDDLLKVPGFIAGVTNPHFENRPEWWDLLCDLGTGRMKISNRTEIPPPSEGLLAFQQQNPGLASLITNSAGVNAQGFTGDAVFMDTMQRNITNRLGEGTIRSMWRDWVLKLTRITATFEEMVYGASALDIGAARADEGAFGITGHGYVWSDEASKMRELAGNVQRIEGWRNSRSYYSLVRDIGILYESRPIRAIDLFHHHDRLRTQKLQTEESAAIYLAFEKAVRSPSEICQLLTVTPESHGGLFYLSLGLLHRRQDVRHRTVDLLYRILRHEAGRHFWSTLGKFAKLAFYRIRREMEAVGMASGKEGDATTLLARGTEQLELSEVRSTEG